MFTKRPRFRHRIEKRIACLTWPDGRGIVRRDGILYLLNLRRPLQCDDKHILQWGAADPAQREYFLDQIRRRNCVTFLDIGAHSGLYAAGVALQTDCSTIIAYEPDQRSCDRLRTHLLINHLTDKVQTRMVAVSNHNGPVPFVFGPTNAESLSKVGDDGGGVAVLAVRLDEELPLTGQRIALKIDIEGHELAALDGMKSLLRSNDCFLQVKCWDEKAGRFISAMQTEGYHLLHRIPGDHFDYYFPLGFDSTADGQNRAAHLKQTAPFLHRRHDEPRTMRLLRQPGDDARSPTTRKAIYATAPRQSHYRASMRPVQ